MLRTIGFSLMMAAAGSAVGAEADLFGVVTRTLIDGRFYGGCMAKIVPGPETIGIECSPEYVTFSCSGDFNTKEVGNRKFSGAQLSLVSQGRVSVRVDDTKKHNGYCYARRLDNIAN